MGFLWMRKGRFGLLGMFRGEEVGAMMPEDV